jgi:PTS system nitrogen regulatory IIA component
METVVQWLCPQSIELDLDVPDRWEALREVSAMIERLRRLSAPPIFRALWRREMAASTGVGNGFAIPHARIAGIVEPITAYVRTKSPLEFAAPDGKRVSELFVILVPADGDNEKHLQLLALVAEVFSNREFRARLTAAMDPQDVHAAFSQRIRERQRDANESPGATIEDASDGRSCNATPTLGCCRFLGRLVKADDGTDGSLWESNCRAGARPSGTR